MVEWWVGGIRKSGFVERDMSRYQNASGGNIKAAVSFVSRWVAEEYAFGGTWCKLVTGDGGCIDVT